MNPSDSMPEQYMANILVVDDMEIEAQPLTDALKEFGCHVERAHGVDVVEKLSKYHDIIFLDINMPHISGLEIAKNLQQSGRDKHTGAIIIVSKGNFTPAMQKICMSLDIDGYIQKPVQIEELQEVLSTHLSHKAITLSGTDGSARGFLKKK